MKKTTLVFLCVCMLLIPSSLCRAETAISEGNSLQQYRTDTPLEVEAEIPRVSLSNNGVSHKWEGDGFDSPEDAVKAYLDGLRDKDLSLMISTFAIYKYDLEAYLNTIPLYSPGVTNLYTMANEFAASLNIKNRRGRVANSIKNYYLFLCDSYPSQSVIVLSEDISEFLSQFNNNLNKPKFHTINIVGFIPMEMPTERDQELLEKMAKAYGADELIEHATAVFNLDGREIMLNYGAAKYGSKWYLIDVSQMKR